MNQISRDRMLNGMRRRNPEVLEAISRRSRKVGWVKAILPLTAALLLAALVAAPSLRTGPAADRVAYHVPQTDSSQAQSHIEEARYHGTDQKGQPFTITAAKADQLGADNVDLNAPVGDMTLKSGSWLELKSDSGVYNQKSQNLGLAGNVTLYRNDGTTVNTAHAQIDMKAGNAQSGDPVSVQGPFGTLNAQNGFILADRGQDVKFLGPSTLVLTETK